MKAVSVSAELMVIERAVEGAALLIEVDRHGGVEGEDSRSLVGAILSLAAVRLRDLGRAARGSLDVEALWAPHNAALDSEEANEEDLILYPAAPAGRTKK